MAAFCASVTGCRSTPASASFFLSRSIASSYADFGPVSPATSLPAEDFREHERRADRGVRLDDELRRVRGELAPRNLLVRHRARVRAVARRRVADLAEVPPQRDVVALQVLMNHRDDANGEVARDAAADLEEADRFPRRVGPIPLGEAHHRLDA